MQHNFNLRDEFSPVSIEFPLIWFFIQCFATFIGTYVSFSLFGTVCILPRNTNGMCMSIVRQRSPPVFDTLGRSTLDRIHPRRSMCHCIDDHSSLECLTGDFSCKIRVTVPNTPNLCRRAICDQDCTVSIGNGIYVKLMIEANKNMIVLVWMLVFWARIRIWKFSTEKIWL